ncbi:MAG: hypothetical protein KGJ33_01195 [Patescibacteria group bacterium]|nr:hypothetical protein [Patescibacteria group bacterium]
MRKKLYVYAGATMAGNGAGQISEFIGILQRELSGSDDGRLMSISGFTIEAVEPHPGSIAGQAGHEWVNDGTAVALVIADVDRFHPRLRLDVRPSRLSAGIRLPLAVFLYHVFSPAENPIELVADRNQCVTEYMYFLRENFSPRGYALAVADSLQRHYFHRASTPACRPNTYAERYEFH